MAIHSTLEKLYLLCLSAKLGGPGARYNVCKATSSKVSSLGDNWGVNLPKPLHGSKTPAQTLRFLPFILQFTTDQTTQKPCSLLVSLK